MSNAIIPIQTAGLPAYLQNFQYEDSGLGAGITSRAPSLGITTEKSFSITKDGKTQVLMEQVTGANGQVFTQPQRTVNVVLIAGAANITKAWYAKSFVPGSKEAPDCFSNDGRTPAPGVKMKQCDTCAGCPKNAFGSHPVTGRGKACGDRKMVVLVWDQAPDQLMTFNVPTMSHNALKNLDNQLREARIPLQAVLVQLSFDPNVTYPVVKMSAVGFLPQEMAEAYMAKAHTQEVSELLREVDFDVADDAPKTQEAQAPAGSLVAPLEQTQQQTQAEPVNTEAMQTQTVTQQPTTEEPPKRKRATKAEMEARRAAAAGGGSAEQQQTATQAQGIEGLMQQTLAAATVQEEQVVDPAAAQIAALQAQLAALQGGQITAPAAAAQQQVAQVTQQVAQTTPAPAVANPGVASNVVDLLNKWKG